MPLAALLLAAVSASAGDADAALAHRQQYPQAEWGYHYYLSTSAAAAEHREELSQAIRLVVASSSLEPVVERSTPQPVAGSNLLHIDLRELRWDHRDWLRVLRRYPYHHGHGLPLVVRADWLLLELSDGTRSDAYYRLLFGGDNIPQQRDDWLDLLKVSRERGDDFDALRFGLIESQSGVAKQEARWIESHPVLGGYAWGTRDVLQVREENDPLEHPDGDFRHDGEEWIVGIPKVHLASGVRGTLQVYLLSNGRGGVVQEAPVDLVEDATKFRGTREIRNPGSCHQCHSEGLQYPSTNEFRKLIADGVDVYADDKTQRQLEAFHLGKLERAIERANEDFQAIVQAVTGVPSTAAAAAFKASVNRYDASLDLEATARELRTTPDEWRNALGLASVELKQLGARVAGLAHGRTIPRAAWEDQYLAAKQHLINWRRR